MNGTIVTSMTRGQITLPKKYREKLGINPGTPLNVILEENKIVITPLTQVAPPQSQLVIKPKYTPQEYKKVLKEVNEYMKKHGPLWTKADDRAREKMKKAEEKRWKRLRW